MTNGPVQYSLQDHVATIRIDDGKRNALSPQVLSEIYAALDRAEADRAIVIITGRESVFSAGFDLNVMKRGGMNALRMLRAGYAMTARVMAYPYPVIAACNGHSLAMGVFLMLSADHIIGSRGDFKIAANEVAIGMTMPRVAAATLRQRLNPAAFQRAVSVSNYFDVESALDAGLFDELVEPSELMARAEICANEFKALDEKAHTVSKRRIRAAVIRKIRFSIPFDLLDAAMVGLRRKPTNPS
ncbi:MAG: crotonase/enoyl-CoA hydratase family protein [Woeseiaceae bacterium]